MLLLITILKINNVLNWIITILH